MSGEIAAVAKNWLTEPRYVGAFKLTSDVFKDYLCNIMLGVGSIVLAVNFLASMGTGPINCMLKSKSNINKQSERLKSRKRRPEVDRLDGR